MRTLYPGERGVLVQYVQLALVRAGYTVRIDGIFGDETCASLREFSERDTCEVDEEVWDMLLPYLKGYQIHQVRNNDTIWSIANKYKTRIQYIMTANPRIDNRNLRPGQFLYIPLNYNIVSQEVAYSSLMNEWVIEGLLVRFPFFVAGSIGKSILGRDLLYIQIGKGDKEVFYNASFHANEWITTPLLLKFAEEYGQSIATGESLYNVRASWLFYNYRLYLVPMVNPDGVDLVNGIIKEGPSYEYARRIAANYENIPFPSGWKANIEGVDLNLQFPAGWEQAKAIKYANGYKGPAPRDYVGPSPLSEPESRAVYNFTIMHNFSLILAYHTQGEVIYWRYLDYEPEGSRGIAQYFGIVSGYEVEETPSVSGYAGYKDWFILAFNRPGYTIEVGKGINPLSMEQFPKIYKDNRLILEGGMTEI